MPRKNILGTCYKVTRAGVYGEHVSWEHSLATGSLLWSLFMVDNIGEG